MSRDAERLAGGLLVGGLQGTTLPEDFARALRQGHRGGAILFRRNVEGFAQVRELTGAIAASGLVSGRVPFIAVDQEGGRVGRLPEGAVHPPPMRQLAAFGEPSRVRRAGRLLGEQLRLLGFNLDFAPVLDVDSNPGNPIIGDRSFGSEPEQVIACARQLAQGLAEAGVLACGKHFPGHGDTDLDSHLDLPVVRHSLERVRRVELRPFAALAAELPTMMSAHVVFDALDPGVPATLSPRVCEDLLRRQLGFEGVLFSDDLEMRALHDRWPVEVTAVGAVRAGCDVLLVCSSWELQERAWVALVREIERDAEFARRAELAASRRGALQARLADPRPTAGAPFVPEGAQEFVWRRPRDAG